ncbi:MAG: hypothetical protein AAF517_14105 [Planctomycetota bacterium]
MERAKIFACLPILLLSLTSCWESEDANAIAVSGKVESCMTCHNGSDHNDYNGSGLENPHPFPGAGSLKCTECHGGDPNGATAATAHVPPPEEIGDEEQQLNNRHAYFNRLTLTGIDKFEDYEVAGVTYSPIDYLQFVNPGDLRVVTEGRSCGQCHKPHVDCVEKSVLATETGILSSSMFTLGLPSEVAASRNLYDDTASDRAFRYIADPNFEFDADRIGPVGELFEFPVFSVRGDDSENAMFRNDELYNAEDLPNYLNDDNSVVPNSPLANLFHEQVAFTCGDCHLGSAGANNRTGDYRSSGCTACHMRYATDGRSRSTDPNINKIEPLDPDDIEPPERPHVRRHLLTSVAQTLTTGEFVEGMDDYTCAGCHQGSNRTVMQYWGIRLDQNQDVRRRQQYPTNPVSFQTTRNDERLFDPEVGNREFNGRNANQYLLVEDYDGDGRDDTPPDVHYEAGLGCIDCHGSHDLHGGTVGDDPTKNPLYSRQEQAVAIRCETCHGSIAEYASHKTGTTYDGTERSLAYDAEGNVLKHVVRESDGNFYLTSRLTGRRHYVPQTRDVVVDNGKVNPLTNQVIYNAKASFSMGRADGDASTGIGPQQADDGVVTAGFSHSDNLNCVACHSSWTNGCTGCHLVGEYNEGNNFSNITGDRIVFREDEAQFVYQTPVMFQLGVDTHNKIAPIAPNTTTFFQYKDRQNNLSQVFSFSDRHGNGNNPDRAVHPSLSHNVMMPHSIRGRVSDTNEGPRYCVSCHLTDEGLGTYRTEYDTFREAMRTQDFASLDFELLQEHFGANTGNQMNSPFWIHAVAGLGSGLFLFDEHGCPVNPLDENERRFGCNDVAPSENYDPARVRLNLDRIVDDNGVAGGSNNHSLLHPGEGPRLRDGALNENLAGPLGATIIQRLTDPDTGIILDTWLDADGQLQGDDLNILNTASASQ